MRRATARIGLLSGLLLMVFGGLVFATPGGALMRSDVENAGGTVAACGGDPCAEALCGAGWASAHAYGSEESWANANTDTQSDSAHRVGSGSSHADAVGPGDSHAYAKGKKNWSLSEAKKEKTCVNGVAATASDAPKILGLTIGCGGSDDVATTQSFVGRLYLDAENALVAYDAGRGEGISLPGPIVVFGARSLESAAAMDVGGMTPTSVFLSLELVAGPLDRCAVSLY